MVITVNKSSLPFQTARTRIKMNNLDDRLIFIENVRILYALMNVFILVRSSFGFNILKELNWRVMR